MATLYHGSTTEPTPRIGMCLTDCDRIASSYAGWRTGQGGVVSELEIDLSGLTVVEVDGYDRDSDEAPGDISYGAELDADVIVYQDESPRGRSNTTWRLVSARAVAAVTIVSTTEV
jgi:hypothetical protein